ncbi:MAG TPA: GlsB/YeaQ/YmgE family stress response membrane protein [Bdellovibrionota bacterium]|jgi:uncharacterized membrane protein YeaQ/YmgE (transglycosylase-associated protein family)
MPSGILATFVIGFVIGLVARFLKPGDDRMGIFMTAMVGIAGAFLGTYIGQLAGIYQSGEPAGFIGAVFGAMLVLFMMKAVFGKK